MVQTAALNGESRSGTMIAENVKFSGIDSSDDCVAASYDEQYFTANGKTDTDLLF